MKLTKKQRYEKRRQRGQTAAKVRSTSRAKQQEYDKKRAADHVAKREQSKAERRFIIS